MIDLHTHSIYSDGSDTPAALVAKAIEVGLAAIALTDHDTVAGIPDFFAAAEGLPLEAVPGIELSADCDSGTMHILGYFIDPDDPDLLHRLEKVRVGREERNREILKKLNKLGYVLLWSDVERQAGEDVVGRPHFAEALLERGYVKTRKAAFDLLLAKGRPAYADRYRLSASECVDLIHRAGGAAVLAHPSTLHLGDTALKAVVGDLRACGLDGIETYYSSHRPEQVGRLEGWAAEFGLVCTGGTDYHGSHTPDIRMGTGFGQLGVADDVLERLRSAVCSR